MKLHFSLAATLLLAVQASVFSQRPASSPVPVAQDDVIRVSSTLVQADVVVTGKSGRQIVDLHSEDFEVFEDGKRQTLTHFSYVSAAPHSEGSEPRTGTESPPNTSSTSLPTSRRTAVTQRTIAVVVDDLGLSAESIVSVRKALRQFVNEQMQPTDRVAIIRTSQGTGALQQFASDRRKLLTAIEQISWFAAGRGGLSTFNLPVHTQWDPDSLQAAHIMSEVEEERASSYAVGTIGALSLIIRGLREIPGRKAVLLIAESFRLFTTQGRNVRLLESLKRLTEQANQASTVIYTMDASGLDPLNLNASDRVSGESYTFNPGDLKLGNRGTPRRNDLAPSAASIALEEGGSNLAFKRLDSLVAQRDNQNIQTQTVLSFLSDRTGGLFTANTNDLSLGTKRVLEDQSGYYLLGYRPSESDIDSSRAGPRFHKLTIKVKRPGVTVRSREGYYTGSNEAVPTAKSSAQRLAAALTSPFAAAAVNLRVTPLFFNDAVAGSYLYVLLHLDARDLTFNEQADKSQKVALEIAAVNLGDDGKVTDQYSGAQTIEVNQESFAGVLRNGVSFVLNVPIKKGGAYQLRIAVRDVNSDRIGSTGQFIRVPDLSANNLTLSGIATSGITDSAATRKAPQPSSNTNELLMQAGPAVRRLVHGMVLSYSYAIYNAALDDTGKPRLETQMFLFREGKQVFEGKPSSFSPGSQADMKRLEVNGGLRLGPELTPGEYILQIVVRDKLRNKSNIAVQVSDFRIVD
jgi:VWFA-related protein